MVYCGKASLGCQSCRKRRIKCDRVRPDCSQCVRVDKKCPGYRDQLSLMFRDESTKVMQKARAQWGSEGADGEASVSGALSVSSETTRSTTSRKPSNSSRPVSPESAVTISPTDSVSSQALILGTAPRITQSIGPTLDEQATNFYINRYVIGHPDEPASIDELSEIPWIWHPMLNDAMVALGLAGLSNLRNDTELMTTARQRYGKALRQTGMLLQSGLAPSHEAMRLIIILALFELVMGAFKQEGSVTTHVLGGTAMIKSWLPTPDLQLSTSKITFSGVRAMLQMAFTMFIPAFVADQPVSPALYELLAFSAAHCGPDDTPALELGRLIGCFVDLAAYIKTHVLSDGRPAARKSLQKLIDLDEQLIQWADGLPQMWRFTVQQEKGLPSDAVFEGEWHIYRDIWIARLWAHWRWARILLQQMVLALAEGCPTTSLTMITASDRLRRLALITQLSRDTLASTPVHWRHPLLEKKKPILVEQVGGGGSGSAGIPVLVFQLQTAACAPGVPDSHWHWASAILECIWSDMGMVHARSMREAMIAHRDKMAKVSTGNLLAPRQLTVRLAT